MSYFAALLVSAGGGWNAREVDLDEVDGLEEVARLARDAGDGENPVLLLVEQEDAWFGVVRVDGEEDPRVFVSDYAAAARSRIAQLLLPDVDDDLDLAALVPDDEPGVAASGPVGDAELLEDLGTDATELVEICGTSGLTPSEAISVLAERSGAEDIYEVLR